MYNQTQHTHVCLSVLTRPLPPLVQCGELDFKCMFYKPVVMSLFQAITDCWHHDPVHTAKCLMEEENLTDFCQFEGNSTAGHK